MYSKNEEWLLNILSHLGKQKENVDLDKLNVIKDKHSKENFSWLPIIKQLKAKQLIIQKENYFSITQKGSVTISKLNKEKMQNGFNKAILVRDKSKIFKKFCEEIHGEFLCQMNMTNKNQINKLIEMLNVKEGQRILDLGCSVGRITEYISDITKAEITGIDIADEVILNAQQRIKDKSDRIKFIASDLDDLNFKTNSFDRIIAIDTIYFSDNIPELVNNLKRILKPNGLMCIFYSQRITEKEDRKRLEAKHTDFANILKEEGLKFTTIEFTEDEKQHWRDEFRVANELKEEFEKANEIEIYNSRIRESKDHLAYINDNRISRYLYVVENS